MRKNGEKKLKFTLDLAKSAALFNYFFLKNINKCTFDISISKENTKALKFGVMYYSIQQNSHFMANQGQCPRRKAVKNSSDGKWDHLLQIKPPKVN